MSLYDISGLLIAVRKDYFRVINHRELLFNDCGDRVAQLLHVELAPPCSPCRNNDTRQEILIVNTHLLFPHDSSLSLVRLNQVSTFSTLCFSLFYLLHRYLLTILGFDLYCMIAITGLQNPAVCGILSERKQAQPNADYALRVITGSYARFS